MSASIIQVHNETTATSSRLTKEGRRVTYRMRVIQQPERARACGSGAKSSADRRPVDPPPIVELKVFEGQNAETDITFSYKANFFLFTTLETAHLPQGRVPPQSQPSFPVLTGTPVAGMAYLDRPEPAGYFIFPDLSVRHEGKYRLAFSLYEELKDRLDMDTEISDSAEQQRSAHVSHRLEVKSVPFTVFSAKKFPGLTESTQLSRIVAEQGCRVRIRRDVRMRRRGGDSKRDYDDDYDEPQGYERNRGSATPDQYGHPMATPQVPVDDMNRPRSASNASNASFVQRRPSMEQISQTYQQSYAGSPVTPQTPQGMYPAHAQVQQQWHGQPPQHASYMQPPPAPSYPPQQQNYQVPQSQPMAPPNYGFMPPQYPSYDNGHARHSSVEYPQPPTGPPRTATPGQPVQHSPQPQMQQYQNMSPYPQNNGYSQPPSHSSPVQQNQPTMQPMHAPPMSSAPSYGVSQPPTAPQYAPPPIPQAEIHPHHQQLEFYDPNNRIVPPKFPHQPQPSGATKRTFAASFNAEPLEQPLRHGARPTVDAADPKYPVYTPAVMEDETMEESAMSYRRADGTERRRTIPLIS